MQKGITIFRWELFVSQCRTQETFCAVSENFRKRKSLWIRGGEYKDFPSKIFCLTVPKHFVEEPFCVSENFWYRKMLGIREGAGITIFRQNGFVLQYRII